MTERVPLLEVGKLLAGLEDLKAKKGEPPWSDPVVLTDDIQAFIICHAPGHRNDTHYHLHDEWWVVRQGEIDWYIEDEPAHPRQGRRLRPRTEKPLASHRAGGHRAVDPRRHQRPGRVPPLQPARLQAPLTSISTR